MTSFKSTARAKYILVEVFTCSVCGVTHENKHNVIIGREVFLNEVPSAKDECKHLDWNYIDNLWICPLHRIERSIRIDGKLFKGFRTTVNNITRMLLEDKESKDIRNNSRDNKGS